MDFEFHEAFLLVIERGDVGRGWGLPGPEVARPAILDPLRRVIPVLEMGEQRYVVEGYLLSLHEADQGGQGYIEIGDIGIEQALEATLGASGIDPTIQDLARTPEGKAFLPIQRLGVEGK
jgi:hypothetical protein